jgi:hypothetical protein
MLIKPMNATSKTRATFNERLTAAVSCLAQATDVFSEYEALTPWMALLHHMNRQVDYIRTQCARSTNNQEQVEDLAFVKSPLIFIESLIDFELAKNAMRELSALETCIDAVANALEDSEYSNRLLIRKALGNVFSGLNLCMRPIWRQYPTLHPDLK